MKKYCILGVDNRSIALRDMYLKEGINIGPIDDADIIIAPIPFSRDDIKVNGESIECEEIIKLLSKSDKVIYTGSISKSMKEKFRENNVKYYDLMELESVTVLNAIPTAEGAIATAMEMTDFTLHGSNVLVMGYGRIGKILAKMLNGIGAHVYCEARKDEDIAQIISMGYKEIKLNNINQYLPNMDVIFNTVPQKILDTSKLALLNKKCSIIDLASSPGGVDFEKAKELKLNVVWALALPGKVAPYTAALYLKNAIDKIELENEC